MAISPAVVSSGDRRHIPLREVTMPHVCPQPVRMHVLRRVPYFAGLSDEELGRIDDRMQAGSWPADSNLYHAGDPAGQLFIVAEGRVKLTQTTASGVTTVADILAPGELFGAMDAVGEPVHLQTATTMVGSCALRIDQDAFRAVLREHPPVALRVLDDVAGRLARAHTDIGGQTTETVAQRVATALLRMADKFGGTTTEGGTLIEVPLSRVDIAGLARSTPESVSRVMSRWRTDGIIDSGRRWTTILDRERLEAEAGA